MRVLFVKNPDSASPVDIPPEAESEVCRLDGLRLLIFPQPLGGALKNQNAAPASPPCFRRRRRSPPLQTAADPSCSPFLCGSHLQSGHSPGSVRPAAQSRLWPAQRHHAPILRRAHPRSLPDAGRPAHQRLRCGHSLPRPAGTQGPASRCLLLHKRCPARQAHSLHDRQLPAGSSARRGYPSRCNKLSS